jgi:hypothetical protein
MKKLIPALALLTLCTSVWLAPSSASAVPKMDVKIAIGVGSTTLVPRVPDIDLYSYGPGGPGDNPMYEGSVGGRNPGTFPNWGMQIGARVTFDNKVFFEMDAGFSRFYFDIGQQLQDIAEFQGNPIPDALKNQQARMNQLEIPLLAGYRPYANPYFKIFVYGGWVSTFNLRGFADIGGNRKAYKFKPKDIPGYPLAIYLAGLRIGTQVDLGPLNFDVSYTIGLNSATATEFRTNTHVFKFFLGWLF